MERIIIQNKRDVMEMLQDARRNITNICSAYFYLSPVNEFTPNRGVFFESKYRAYLKELGALELPQVEYGYFRSNENNALVNAQLSAAGDLLAEILDYMEDCYIRPKAYRFTPEELNRVEVIEGTRGTWLVSRLKDGAANG